jgi:hypothetical protein
MFRDADPPTSKAAAEKVIPILTRIQALVLSAYRLHGPMTAKECERLPAFAEYGFSTVRKRISELVQLGRLVATGVERGGCAEYRLKDSAR